MRLDSDPTVIYGIKDFNGNLTRKDLRTPTPFNTYRRYGLPPTPISNPGHDHGYKKFSSNQISSLIKLLKFLIRKYNINKVRFNIEK